MQSKELEKISPGIAKLLIDQASSVIIMKNVNEEFSKTQNEHMNQFKENLKKNYRIRSLISPWFYEQTKREEVNITMFCFGNLIIINFNCQRKNSIKKIYMQHI